MQEEIKPSAVDKETKPNLFKEHIYLPFAKISEIMEGSPSYCGGLRYNDLICKFGYATESNHNNLTELASVVRDNIGKEIDLIVLRPVGEDHKELKSNEKLVKYKSEDYIQASLTVQPQKWAGAGYLGCRFIQI